MNESENIERALAANGYRIELNPNGGYTLYHHSENIGYYRSLEQANAAFRRSLLSWKGTSKIGAAGISESEQDWENAIAYGDAYVWPTTDQQVAAALREIILTADSVRERLATAQGGEA